MGGGWVGTAAAIRTALDEAQDRIGQAKVLTVYVEIMVAAADVPAARSAADDPDASRRWYQRLLGAAPVLDEDFPAVPEHHQGFRKIGFVVPALAFRDPDNITPELWAPRA